MSHKGTISNNPSLIGFIIHKFPVFLNDLHPIIMPPMEMCIFASLIIKNMRALIFGASGLIGSELLKLTLNDPYFSSVTVVVRKRLSLSNNKLTQIISTFEELEENQMSLQGDIVFSCLGTTKRKTPDPKEYYKIDHDYPILASKIALKNGAKYIHLVSSLGASNSSSSTYLKLKGELENAISKLTFEGIHFYRPSLIVGKRNEDRPLEDISTLIFKIINPLLLGSFRKYRSIAATDIARAMVSKAKQETKGVHIYQSNIIKELA